MDINIYKKALRNLQTLGDFVTHVNIYNVWIPAYAGMTKKPLQHKERECHNQGDKREGEQREEAEAIKRDLHIPKEKAPPPLLGLADFRLTIGANVPHLIAVTDGKVTLHRGHPNLVVKFFMANRTCRLHVLIIIIFSFEQGGYRQRTATASV